MFHFNYNTWLIWISFIIGLIAVYWDLKYRKIPNWLTYPMMVIGISANLMMNLQLWYIPILGLLVGFVLLLIPFIMGGIGAGDVKLLMAFGSFLGAKTVFWITLFGGIAGGVISLIVLLYHFGLRESKMRLILLFSSIWNRESRILLTQKQTKKLYIPYGLAIFIGFIFSVLRGPIWG